MPGEDPFEIAKRLDLHGAGKGPRPPRPDKPVPVAAAPFIKRRSRPFGGLLFLVLVALAVAVWLFFQRNAHLPDSLGGKSPDRQTQPAEFRAQPPKTIPSLNGPGEVPAFTVQIPGDPSSAQTPPTGTNR